MTRLRLIPFVLIPPTLLALVGCGAAPQAEDDDRLQVVASTNVYGSIAQAIGGDLVNVTSLIDSPSQDPHSFEASARDRLAIEDADIVIVNGGGYDPFMEQLLDASSNTPIVIDVSVLVDLPEGGNEHLWYEWPSVNELVRELNASLTEIDPEHRTSYADNGAAFTEGLLEIAGRAAQLAGEFAGKDAVLTEPVPAYLLQAVAVSNVTPPGFSEAIEEGSDVSPRDLEAMLELIDGGTVALLGYNDQTTNAQTEQVRAAAEEAGVPVVSFTETLPEGLDYLEWMSGNLDAIAAALAVE